MTFARLLKISLLHAVFLSTACAADPTCTSSGQDPHYVTVEDIAHTLKGQPPMAVGFDVDETVLFSSPGFYHLVMTRCEGVLDGCNQQPGYWEEANTLDTFSLPKPIGVELVKMHIARGDTVYFITARTGSKNETLSQVLRDLLKAPDLADVVFVGYAPGVNLKTPAIQERNIKIFYGDSDGDIKAAMAQTPPITAYRMLRAQNTLENVYGVPKVGMCGEAVVKDSEL